MRLDRFGDECTEQWREYATYNTPDFFVKLAEEFTELKLIPHPNGEVHFAKDPRNVGSDEDRLKAIFREHGWPSEEYRKEDCIKKVSEFYKNTGVGTNLMV